MRGKVEGQMGIAIPRDGGGFPGAPGRGLPACRAQAAPGEGQRQLFSVLGFRFFGDGIAAVGRRQGLLGGAEKWGRLARHEESEQTTGQSGAEDEAGR